MLILVTPHSCNGAMQCIQIRLVGKKRGVVVLWHGPVLPLNWRWRYGSIIIGLGVSSAPPSLLLSVLSTPLIQMVVTASEWYEYFTKPDFVAHLYT